MAALFTNRTTNGISSALLIEEGITTLVIDGEFDKSNLLLLTSLTENGEYVVEERFTKPTRRNITVSGNMYIKVQLVGENENTSVSAATP
jgi:hypothetical protein